MATKFTEKVVCLYCDKSTLLKNLSTHNKAKHNGMKLRYKSAVSKNLKCMLGKGTIQETGENEQVPETSKDNLEPPIKVACVEPVNTVAVEKPEQSQLLEDLTTKICELSSQVNKLINVSQEEQKQTKQKVSVSSSINNNVPNNDEKHLIILHSRSVNQILKWLENWILVEDGLKCSACSHVINYNYQVEGMDFIGENLPRSFKNMRTSIVRHLESESHLKKHCLLMKMKNEEREVMKKGRECGLNCAGIAYTTLFFSESAKSYEHHIADAYNCGGVVGSKNHSSRFPYLFLPHLYDVIRSDIKNFVIINKLQIWCDG